MLPIARRANLNASGARPSGDRIKIAGLQAKTALFCWDAAQVSDVMQVIEGEIKIVEPGKRGIQAWFFPRAAYRWYDTIPVRGNER